MDLHIAESLQHEGGAVRELIQLVFDEEIERPFGL
jgi:hypothetical protein